MNEKEGRSGLLETNLDNESQLDELMKSLERLALRPHYSSATGSAAHCADASASADGGGPQAAHQSAAADASHSPCESKRFKSMLNLGCSASGHPHSQQTGRLDSALMDSPQSRRDDANRAKSMEFLLDEDNKSALQVTTFTFDLLFVLFVDLLPAASGSVSSRFHLGFISQPFFD